MPRLMDSCSSVWLLFTMTMVWRLSLTLAHRRS